MWVVHFNVSIDRRVPEKRSQETRREAETLVPGGWAATMTGRKDESRCHSTSPSSQEAGDGAQVELEVGVAPEGPDCDSNCSDCSSGLKLANKNKSLLK